MMTKKHFISIANDLIQAKQGWVTRHGQDAYEELVDFIAGVCKRQNSNFRYGIFKGYINGENGPSGGEIKKRKEPI